MQTLKLQWNACTMSISPFMDHFLFSFCIESHMCQKQASLWVSVWSAVWLLSPVNVDTEMKSETLRHTCSRCGWSFQLNEKTVMEIKQHTDWQTLTLLSCWTHFVLHYWPINIGLVVLHCIYYNLWCIWLWAEWSPVIYTCTKSKPAVFTHTPQQTSQQCTREAALLLRSDALNIVKFASLSAFKNKSQIQNSKNFFSCQFNCNRLKALVKTFVYQVEDDIITCLKTTGVETVLYHFITFITTWNPNAKSWNVAFER